MRCLLLLLLCPTVFTDACPRGCSCSNPSNIFCINSQLKSMPEGLPEDTKNLFLFQNGISSLSAEKFAGLDSLELLDLSQNLVSELPSQVFRPLSSLRNLDLSSNEIVEISRGSFAGLGLLERLYLNGNRIKSIHPSAFDGLGHLLELKLQNNQLTTLPALHVPKLLLLDISFNKIPSLRPEDLQTVNLESLKMAGMGLSYLDDNLLKSLGNLHDLDLSKNQLKAVPAALKQARGLTKLSLAGNTQVSQLKKEDFQNLESLQELDLSNLNLQGFPDGFLQLFSRLHTLSVAENPFNCICPLAWFPPWVQSSKVHLQRNEETRCHFPLLNAGKILKTLEHKEFGCPTTTTMMTTTFTTTTPDPPVISTLSTTTMTITTSSESPLADDERSPPPGSPEPNSSSDPDVWFCPSNICLNGGSCQLDHKGNLECTCPTGSWGLYCEEKEDTTLPVSTPTVTTEPAISPRAATSTSILVDLHRYIQARPQLRGIRLTYKNLSGPDKRPVQISVPASYPEYTLRGLRPNSTYHICASPLAEPGKEDSFCMVARTSSVPQTPAPVTQTKDAELTAMIIPLVAVVLLIAVAAAGATYYVRRRRAKGHPDLGADPCPLELEGVKACLENGALPQKTPELSQPQNGLEYEVPLMQGQNPANNNVAVLKPSYF
ncbi:vasorin b [Lepisosteus oculatus]|uniref:vasorin b n=1 Tax=Lepisosteus oculatus TaxID=7918 RepID=UPI0035F51685